MTEPLDLEPIKMRMAENYHRVRFPHRAARDIALLVAEVEMLRDHLARALAVADRSLDEWERRAR